MLNACGKRSQRKTRAVVPLEVDMTLTRIDHIQLAMPAGQEEAARIFYGQLLGLTEQTKPAHLAARGGCWFQSGDVKVHLGVDPDFVPARKAHPAFLVDDLDSLCATLDAAGFPTVPDQPLDGYRRKYASDPFGNRIELMETLDDERGHFSGGKMAHERRSVR
ncbi:MAG: glyoxalase [Proteobacteria bacterium]|nr:glyoxalase [Pseudomonadota bacterium]